MLDDRHEEIESLVAGGAGIGVGWRQPAQKAADEIRVATAEDCHE